MFKDCFSRWIVKTFSSANAHRIRPGQKLRFKPVLENIEDRVVPSAPIVTTNPSNEAVPVGNNATFTAAATGTSAPTVEWAVSTDGGQTFSPITPGGIYSESVNPDTLTITAPPESMNGNEYEAVFNDGIDAPVVTTAATLNVGIAPTVLLNPTGNIGNIVNVGGAINFRALANVSTFPAASMQWYVNENNGNGFTPVSIGGVYSIDVHSSELDIYPVSAGMNGYEYEAVFSNPLGSATTTAVTLSVVGLVTTEGPHVLIYDTSHNLVETLTPFGNNVTSVQAVQAPIGFISGLYNTDLVVASGPGGGQIKVYGDFSQQVWQTITPYGASYTGGLNVALGNADYQNMVVAPDVGGRDIFFYGDDVEEREFQSLTAFVPFTNLFPTRNYTGGLNVAFGNLNGSGQDTIILGTNAPQLAYVGEWNIVTSLENYYLQTTYQAVSGPIFAYPGEGAYVSTYASTPGGKADLVVGTDNLNGTGKLAHLYIQNGTTGSLIAQVPSNGLNVFDYGNSGQVRVGVMDVNGDGIPDIVVATGPGPTQEVRVFDLISNVPQLVETLSAAELDLSSGYNGGLYVG
jgi:hypothetical protein